ncbi:MAG TPA: hypothetical protein VGL86_03895 [Polyangia bacterium]|jgi:hypothetical protein
MTRTQLTIGILALGAALGGAACYGEYAVATPTYARARPVTIAVAPPPPVDEVPPPQPYAGSVWMAGYWDWRADLGKHVWIAGHWAMPPRAGVVYMPPSWHPSVHGGYYRVPGRWIAGSPRDAYGRHIAYDAAGRPHYF